MTGEKGALPNLRVLDLTRVLAGPFCTMILSDMGAEVIKVESLRIGDDSRSYPPFIKGESAYFMNLNRGKKSITLNLKHPEGKGIFLELAKISDIVVENFRPGVMEELGIGYETLKIVNPRIIYASISGFGRTGPYKDKPGYDIIGQAMGGIMSVTGWPGGPPTRTGTAIADILAGLSATIGILAAVNARNITNKGQVVDVALVDSVVAAMETLLQIYFAEGRTPRRIGNRYEFIYPYDAFEAKDGWFVLGVGNDKIWERLCKLMKEKGVDANFDGLESNEKRVKNHQRVKKIIQNWVHDFTTNSITKLLMDYRIPAASVYSVKDIVNDPHIAEARGMVVKLKHPKLGELNLTGPHIKLSDTPSCIRSLPPSLGEDNEKVLSKYLNLSKDKIKVLQDKGII